MGKRALVSFLFLIVGLSGGEVRGQGRLPDQLTIAFDASIATSFLDPAETPGIGTPFVFLYAMHDALIKPLPGNSMAPCLAESWTESADGLVYEFKLREGLKFHNGDPFTAEDVKFSFQRYKGTSSKLLHDRVKSVDTVDPHRLRFVLQAPWPDFLVFYATPATGAAGSFPRSTSRRSARRASSASRSASAPIGSCTPDVSFLTRLRGLTLGFDAFISYARADGTGYARELARRLAELDFACFLDTSEIQGGARLTASLERNLRRSEALVFVGTPGALRSPYTRLESTPFRTSAAARAASSR